MIKHNYGLALLAAMVSASIKSKNKQAREA